jgi:hypothetical protein
LLTHLLLRKRADTPKGFAVKPWETRCLGFARKTIDVAVNHTSRVPCYNGAMGTV